MIHFVTIAGYSVQQGMVVKIIGGSFGSKGSVKVDYQAKTIGVNGVVSKTYSGADVAAVDVDQQKEAKTSVLSILFGLFLLTPALTLFFGPFGFAGGLVLTIFGSRYTTTEHTATVRFADGKEVRLSGWHYQVNKLPTLAGA